MPRFRRRRLRRHFRRRRTRFQRRVLNAELKLGSTKKLLLYQNTANSLAQGDGTSRVLRIWTPWSYISQGTGDSNFAGNTIYPKGVSIKGLFYATTNEDVFVRYTYLWSRSSTAFTHQQFSSTTRAGLGPTQTQPYFNPQLFDELATVGYEPYVGLSYGSRFDTTQVKVIASKLIHLNAPGSGTPVKPYKVWFRHPRRKLKFQETAENPLNSFPNFPTYGNFYVVEQAFAQGGAANISSSTVVSQDIEIFVYWKDGPQ